MITGAVLLLFSEALLFRSWPVALWMIIFFACKTAYFLFMEEKELEKRFHKDYLIYKANVPRWIPRLRPWKQVD
jgi:protein-S-isoprenylcysteine O-methyltransferase Ste14